MAQATARILDSTCAVERGLENERTTPRATFRRGQLSLQSNEIFGRTNPIPKRSRRRANCAQAFVAGPAVFPLYFQRAALAEVPAAGRRRQSLSSAVVVATVKIERRRGPIFIRFGAEHNIVRATNPCPSGYSPPARAPCTLPAA